uniref:Integrase catalytic domain-containing protein n=1 Tax=Anopheles albimanus TaxID=7167 RepID=A0A182FZD4_ANOAL
KKLSLIAETFGDPRRIICDRGAAFTSGQFEEYCAERNIELHRIVTGVPRGNGQVERIHRVIIPVLTKLSAEKPEEWFKHVGKVQTVVNNSWQRAIRMTPFELLVGTKMRTKDDVRICELIREELEDNFIEERAELREVARTNIQKIQQENSKYYNLRRRPEIKYRVGDIVGIPVTQFVVGGKVKPRYYGPYRITKLYPNSRCEVEKINKEVQGPRVTTTATDALKGWPLLGQK